MCVCASVSNMELHPLILGSYYWRFISVCVSFCAEQFTCHAPVFASIQQFHILCLSFFFTIFLSFFFFILYLNVPTTIRICILHAKMINNYHQYVFSVTYFQSVHLKKGMLHSLFTKHNTYVL